MTRLGRSLGPALVLAVACAHAPASPSADPLDVRAAIAANNAQFAGAMTKANAAEIAAMFTEDGEVIPPAAKGFITGRAALESYYAARFKTARVLEVEIKTVAVEVSGDLAWETGTNRVVVQAGDGAPTTRTGRYLVAWKRGSDGRWRYRVDAVIPDPAG